MTSSADFHLNIIIPTRDRADCLEVTLRQLCSYKDNNITIIVSDNYSADNTKFIVKKINDSRIKYVQTSKRLSLSDNWDFALSNVSAGWVTIIGDDDGLLIDQALSLITQARNQNIELVRTLPVQYSWPGVHPRFPDGGAYIPKKRYDRIVCSQGVLNKAKSLNIGYMELPLVYNGGIVSFELLKKVRGPDGSFFPNRNPDLYLGVRLAQETDRYLLSSKIISINGASSHSNGFSKHSEHGNYLAKNSPSEKYLKENNKLPYNNMPDPLPRNLTATFLESFLWAYEQKHGSKLEINHFYLICRVLMGSKSMALKETFAWCTEWLEREGVSLSIYQRALFHALYLMGSTKIFHYNNKRKRFFRRSLLIKGTRHSKDIETISLYVRALIQREVLK